MRASLLLVVICGLFAASHSQALDLKEIGTSLVNAAVEQGKQFLSNALQTLLGKFTGVFGKREMIGLSDLMKKLGDAWSKHKDMLAGKFSTAMDKLKALKERFTAKLGLLKDTKEVDDAVDAVVAEHKEAHKRILGDLIQKGKDLLGSAVETVKGLFSGLKDKASALASSLLQKGTDIFVGKRATLSDHLKTIGGVISSAVSPFKDIVAGLGSTLKGHFSNLVDTVKGHAAALKGKLSGHVDDLKKHGSTLLQHGKNALGALSEVVSDILKQTITNAQPAIDGLGKTLTDGAGVALGHFTGGTN